MVDDDIGQRRTTTRRGWGEVVARAGGAAVIFFVVGWLWSVFDDRPFAAYAGQMAVPLVVFVLVTVIAMAWGQRGARKRPEQPR